jgi:peroxidase
MRLDNDGNEAPGGHMALQDAFFNPDEVFDHGVDSLLLGLASQAAQEVDTWLVDDVRNFLFGPPGAGGFDLAALNIQRGRDYGLPGFNELRSVLGLTPKTDFLDLTGGNQLLADRFASVYTDINEVDLWIGGLAEPHQGGGMIGETFLRILIEQFARTRDGDRFFYLNDLSQLTILDPLFMENTSLSNIIQRNSGITNIQANVFLLADVSAVPEPSISILLLIAAVSWTLGIGGREIGRRCLSSDGTMAG